MNKRNLEKLCNFNTVTLHQTTELLIYDTVTVSNISVMSELYKIYKNFLTSPLKCNFQRCWTFSSWAGWPANLWAHTLSYWLNNIHLWILMFLQRCSWEFHSSGIWSCISGKSDPDISRQVPIFKVWKCPRNSFWAFCHTPEQWHPHHTPA